MSDNEYLPRSFPCNECHSGMLHPRHITYFTWLGTELITVPHFPAWVCDVCGKREYDEKAINWLNMILDPNAGKPNAKKRRSISRPNHRTGSSRPARNT